MMASGHDFVEAGAGEPVIFLHGIGGNYHSFEPQLTALKGFRNIAWNMPGYGSSEANVWPPTFASLSDALSDFLVHMNLDSAHLVGHSIGGMLALEHAVRKPEHVRSLTLVGTTPSFGGRDDSFKEAFLKARLAPLDVLNLGGGRARG